MWSQIFSKTAKTGSVDLEGFNFKVAKKLISKISNQVEIKSMEYIQKYISSEIKVGVVLFDRERKIRSISHNSEKMFSKFLLYKLK